MPSWSSFRAFSDDLDQMISGLSGPEKRKITRLEGEAAQLIAAKAAADDLGSDRAFSGFTRQHQIVLDTRLQDAPDYNTLLTPTKLSAGPWTVAEFGRNQGNASGFSGPGVNRATGATARTKAGRVRKVRERQSKRWNGTTRPKNTASDALRVMDRELPKVADKAVGLVVRKHFDVT